MNSTLYLHETSLQVWKDFHGYSLSVFGCVVRGRDYGSRLGIIQVLVCHLFTWGMSFMIIDKKRFCEVIHPFVSKENPFLHNYIGNDQVRMEECIISKTFGVWQLERKVLKNQTGPSRQEDQNFCLLFDIGIKVYIQQISNFFQYELY